MEISSKIMTTCPACGGQSAALFETFPPYHLYRCDICDLVFTDPMHAMQSTEYAQRYDARELHAGFAAALEQGHEFFFKRHGHRRTAGGNTDRAADRPTLLDIGTSTGLFVHACREYGIEARGIDTDAAAIKLGQKLFPDARLDCADLEAIEKDTNARFDYVTLFEVLEHVAAPRDLLTRCRSLLKSHGTLVVFVPNRNRTPPLYREMVERGDDVPPHHLTKWSKQSLRSVLIREGFRSPVIWDIGKYHFPLLPSLGIATRIRRSVVSEKSTTPTSPATPTISVASQSQAMDYNESARKTYTRLAKLRTRLDQLLFFEVDLYYKSRGFERDGLYIEGTL